MHEHQATDHVAPAVPRETTPAGISYGDFGRSLDAVTPHQFAIFVLMAVNVLVFWIMVNAGVSAEEPTTESLIVWGGNFGPLVVNGEWWRLITYQFIHAGWFHLAMNMGCLISVGLLCEKLIGNVGLVVVYLVSGVAGGIVHLYWDPYAPAVGSSGSVFGVAGALLGFVTLRVDSIPRTVREKILQDILIFVGLSVYYGFNSTRIDHAAHIGGFLVGLASGLILSQPLPIEVRRRTSRNAAVACVGAVLAGVAFAFAPQLTTIEKDVQYVLDTEPKVIQTFVALGEDFRGGRMSERQFADSLEKEVLAPWSEMCERLETVLEAPYGNKELVEQFFRCFRLREESWRLQVRAVREMNDGHWKEAFAKWTEAEEVSTRLNQNVDAAHPRSDE